MTTLWLVVFFVSSSLFSSDEAAKILVVFPLAGPSHGILGNGYVEHLLNAGHEVTYVTPFPRKDPPSNLHQVVIEYPSDMLTDSYFTLDKILSKEIDVKDMSWMFKVFIDFTEYFLKYDTVQKLINDQNQTFDLAIVEWLFIDVGAGFAPLFQCPLIWSSSVEPHWMILQLVDEAANPAYVADSMSNNTPPFTFLERLQELWAQIKTSILMKFFLDPKMNSLYDDVFVAAGRKRGVTMPSYKEAVYNASFVISNSHVSLGEPVRLPQNFIPVAGYHINQKTEPLPKDFQKIMDEAKDGVIYFSMGSNLKSKDLPAKMKKEFLDMFRELKQTVIWKFEETLPDLPKNVHMLKWAPQQSILAHPNCVLFITHGGLLSTTETVHFGVPIIGIPVFADQFVNVDRAVNKGIARKVDFSYDTPKELKKEIEEVLNNPSYREKVKYLSMVYHDRPVPPAKQLVHWVEHVVKTKGAPHLRSRALMTPWYQKMYLDLAALVALVLYTVYRMIKKIFRRKNSLSKHKKNN